MTYAIAATAKGHQVYRTINGIYRLNVGPAWSTPRAAIAYVHCLAAIEALAVSPLLQYSAADSTRTPDLPSVDDESAAEPRRSGTPDV